MLTYTLHLLKTYTINTIIYIHFPKSNTYKKILSYKLHQTKIIIK